MRPGGHGSSWGIVNDSQHIRVAGESGCGIMLLYTGICSDFSVAIKCFLQERSRSAALGAATFSRS